MFLFYFIFLFAIRTKSIHFSFLLQNYVFHKFFLGGGNTEFPPVPDAPAGRDAREQDCDDVRCLQLEPETEQRLAERSAVCRRDPEDIGRDDEGHECARHGGDPPRLAVPQQPDCAGRQRAACEHLIAPCEVDPELVEGLGALVRPPEQERDDGDQRQAEQKAVPDRLLLNAEHFRQTQPQTPHRRVAGGYGEDDDADDRHRPC